MASRKEKDAVVPYAKAFGMMQRLETVFGLPRDVGLIWTSACGADLYQKWISRHLDTLSIFQLSLLGFATSAR